ncbi:MAG TPA: VCBS repeat-containing protein [Candidatus Thermoplasmatota archaeon]|nr:VCBS repeat-containing protein [Candidatus Thermoplasmatota archaeon]
MSPRPLGLPRAAYWAFLFVCLLIGGSIVAIADHVQTENGKAVNFHHGTDGNEWWVSVTLSGTDAGTVTKVEGMDTGGPWTTLAKQSWGAYAASFHIEPGHQVRFRATWGNGVVITSCWFTHPAGVEQCGTTTGTTTSTTTSTTTTPPPPPSGWQVATVGEAGTATYGGDMAIADIDGDGRRDVVVGRGNGLRAYEWTGTAWTTEVISERLFDAIAAGDGDVDGTSEVYGLAVGTPGMDLLQYHKVNGLWVETFVMKLQEPVAGDMTIGNIDGAAGPELYLGMYYTECDPDPNVPLCSSTSRIYKVWQDTAWRSSMIATLAGHLDSMWIGDGDNDGSSELYVGHGTRHADRTSQVKLVSGTWRVVGFSGSGSDSGFSLVVVGDGDRDGRNEVYQVNYYGVFLKHFYTAANGWDYDTMFGFNGMTSPEGYEVHPTSLFLGDADNDGAQELYMATDNGEVYQVRWSGSAWVATRIAYPQDPYRGTGGAGLLVVGDGDGDGRREVYTAISFYMANTGEAGVSRVFKVFLPPSGFDATFKGVRGNEWWEQVTVTTTGGTLSRVDIRLNGGAWQPLQKQSWGGYAASYRAVQGTIVQFRATSTTGATELSDCYRWVPPSNTDATKVTCPGSTGTTTTTTTSTTGTTTGAFDATFSGVSGNEWWVQATVKANQPLQKVEARIDCGSTYHLLAKQSWGGWAASFHVPDGSKVTFRATSGTGATDSSGGYIWPGATPTGGC